jgi:RecB family endonuclease NucS
LVDDFKVYPNPTLGNIIVKGIGINTIEVYTVLGEKIKLYRNDENDTSVLIDLKNQKSGVYFLKIHSSNGVFSRKVIRME